MPLHVLQDLFVGAPFIKFFFQTVYRCAAVSALSTITGTTDTSPPHAGAYDGLPTNYAGGVLIVFNLYFFAFLVMINFRPHIIGFSMAVAFLSSGEGVV